MSSGVHYVLGPFKVTLDLKPTLFNIPVKVSLEGTYTPKVFRVSLWQNCTPSFFIGDVSPNKATSAFTTPSAGTFHVCVTSDDDTTLMYAGSVVVVQMQADTTTAVRFKTNRLAWRPTFEGFSFYLSQTVLCATQQFFTSERILLNAEAGNYTLCQQVGLAASPSVNSVLVISPYQSTVPTSVQAHVPFDILINGGDILQRSQVELFTILAPGNCTGTRIQTFVFATPADFILTLTSGQYVSVLACIATADGTIVQPLGIVTPLPYMKPYSVVAGVAVAVSGNMKFGYAREISAHLFWSPGTPLELLYTTVKV